eukprot:9066978-Alexandrium_andersonii.AAC.1
MVAGNALFPPRDEKLATYKEDKRGLVGHPVRRPAYEVLDYVVVQHRWKNAVKNVESNMQAGVYSDHFPLQVAIRVNLRAKYEKERKETWEASVCNAQQKSAYNAKLSSTLPTECSMDALNAWATVAARDTFPWRLRNKRKFELSTTTKSLIQMRMEAHADGRGAVAAELTKRIKRSVRTDRRRWLRDSVSKDLDVRDWWLGLKHMRKGFQPIPLGMKSSEGQHV